MAMLGGPRQSRTAHEYVRATVRAAILDGSLGPGGRLVQAEIAEQLGVSITPVREALRDLASESLVLMDPHRGALVRALDLAEVREIYELRMVLEPLMVRRVIAQVTDQQLALAQSLQEQMERTEDSSAWASLNRDFHAVFHHGADGSRLAVILEGLRNSATAYVRLSLHARPDQVPVANSEHAELIDLIRRRETESAVHLTVQHLQGTLAAIEQTQET